jgi:TonB family protein
MKLLIEHAQLACATVVVVVIIGLPRVVLGQRADVPPQNAAPPTAATGDGGSDPEALTAPSLLTRREAAYPDEALLQHLEGNVGLELVVGDDGRVVDAQVTIPAGHGFDEAALAAARDFVFSPARRGGKPIRSAVQFTYEFHMPPEAPSVAPTPVAARVPVAPPEVTQQGSDQSTLVLAQRPISAASSLTVRDRDFRLRPIGSVADILRVTPGILVTQHAGGGKANQYFLRGFDADHGTDIALSIDGIPINMVSHAHGQGYADSNFVIPEIVERVEVTKGPYFAELGDFSTAGSVNLVTRNDFEHSSIGFGAGGSPGYGGPSYRALLIASPKMESIKPMFVAEIGRSNGPFANPERFDRYKVFNKVSFKPTPSSTFFVGASSYAGDWYGSGQIPSREVSAGRLDRFSTHDASEGGDSARNQLFAMYKVRPAINTEVQAMAYLAQYRLNIISNFTINLVDPDNGDQITQKDRRVFTGGKVSYRVVNEVESLRFDTTIGGNVRSDTTKVTLDHTRQREFLASIANNQVNETSVGAFGREEIALTKWLRVVGGARADFFSFAVDDNLEQSNAPGGATSGVRGASQLSPKAAVIVTPLSAKDVQLDVYGNYGHGFHSNDARGVVRSRDAVTPLTRAIGYEGGSRVRLFDRWDVAATLWRLDLQSEIVWLGDAGTTEPSAPTKRYGVELETRFEITPWLAADLDLTATKSAFTENRGNGNAVALAPRNTWAGGLSARHPSGLRGGIRFYGVGDRPATQDEFIVAQGFTVVDFHAGYQAKKFEVGLDIENLLDSQYKAAQFATTSRLRTEPPTSAPAPAGACQNGSRVATQPNGNFGGCEDNLFSPGLPFTVRLMTTFYLD